MCLGLVSIVVGSCLGINLPKQYRSWLAGNNSYVKEKPMVLKWIDKPLELPQDARVFRSAVDALLVANRRCSQRFAEDDQGDDRYELDEVFAELIGEVVRDYVLGGCPEAKEQRELHVKSYWESRGAIWNGLDQFKIDHEMVWMVNSMETCRNQIVYS
mgnify:FL=1